MATEALGSLLMGFFDFYGNHFPYETSYISPKEGKILPKESKGWENDNRPDAFCIECLIDPSRSHIANRLVQRDDTVLDNDVGKAAQKVRQLREAFCEAYDTLRSGELSSERCNMSEKILGLTTEVPFSTLTQKLSIADASVIFQDTITSGSYSRTCSFWLFEEDSSCYHSTTSTSAAGR